MSVLRITRTSISRTSGPHIPPFAWTPREMPFPVGGVRHPPRMAWTAFPSADYLPAASRILRVTGGYGGSVALGLSPCRQSRVSCVTDVAGRFRRPVCVLGAVMDGPASRGTCLPDDNRFWLSGGTWFQSPFPSPRNYSSDTGFQAIQPSPCRPDLARACSLMTSLHPGFPSMLFFPLLFSMRVVTPAGLAR